MSQHIIEWGTSPRLSAFLRNGLSWQHGIALDRIGNQVWFRAINSTGYLTNGRISFPANRIDELIHELNAIKEEYNEMCKESE